MAKVELSFRILLPDCEENDDFGENRKIKRVKKNVLASSLIELARSPENFVGTTVSVNPANPPDVLDDEKTLAELGIADGTALIIRTHLRRHLLRSGGLLRRIRGLQLQCEVEPLMPTILLRSSGIDEVGSDSQPQEPDAEPSQATERACRPKRRTIVGEDPSWHSVFLEGDLQAPLHVLELWRKQRAAMQSEPAHRIV